MFASGELVPVDALERGHDERERSGWRDGAVLQAVSGKIGSGSEEVFVAELDGKPAVHAPVRSNRSRTAGDEQPWFELAPGRIVLTDGARVAFLRVQDVREAWVLWPNLPGGFEEVPAGEWYDPWGAECGKPNQMKVQVHAVGLALTGDLAREALLFADKVRIGTDPGAPYESRSAYDDSIDPVWRIFGMTRGNDGAYYGYDSDLKQYYGRVDLGGAELTSAPEGTELPGGWRSLGGGLFAAPRGDSGSAVVAMLAKRSEISPKHAHRLLHDVVDYEMSFPESLLRDNPQRVRDAMLEALLKKLTRQYRIQVERARREELHKLSEKKKLSLSLELLRAAPPDARITVEDSLDFGNCSRGTRAFCIRHGLGSSQTAASLLARPDIELLLLEPSFRDLIFHVLDPALKNNEKPEGDETQQ
jgi:hypothetical protein